MATPPQVSSSFSDIFVDGAPDTERMVDMLGQHLFSIRNNCLQIVRKCVGDKECRDNLGTLKAKPFAAVAELGTEASEASLALAKAAIDLFIQDVLRLFDNKGNDVKLGHKHSLRYRLILEIIDIATGTPAIDVVVNRDGRKALVEYFGRWLNRYGSGHSK